MAQSPCVIANGKQVEARLPCTIAEFLIAQQLLPRSVVVEHNGEAVAPFSAAHTIPFDVPLADMDGVVPG